MRHSEFLDERSNVLFVLSYMKGGTAGPWATQRINSILYPSEVEEVTWAGFVSELDKMFADCQDWVKPGEDVPAGLGTRPQRLRRSAVPCTTTCVPYLSDGVLAVRNRRRGGNLVDIRTSCIRL